jgi:hypothetical protein
MVASVAPRQAAFPNVKLRQTVPAQFDAYVRRLVKTRLRSFFEQAKSQ